MRQWEGAAERLEGNFGGQEEGVQMLLAFAVGSARELTMTTHVGPVQEGDPSESPNISLRPPSFSHSQLCSSTDVLTHSHAYFHSHIYSPLTPKETQSLYQSVWAELCLRNKHPQILTQHGSRGFTHTYSISFTHCRTLPRPLTHTDTQSLYQSAWAGLCCSNKQDLRTV